jgi:hypothetical protein
VELAVLYTALKNSISGGKLTLRAKGATGNAFLYLMFAVRSSELELLNPLVTLDLDAKITISATMTVPVLLGTYRVEMSIRKKTGVDAGGDDPDTSDFIVSFEARDDALSEKADRVFGKIFPTYVRRDASSSGYEDILGGVNVTSMGLSYREDDYDELPISFSCHVKLPAGGVWDSDLVSAILPIGGAEGAMNGRLAPGYTDGAVKFRAKLDLSSDYHFSHPMTGITAKQDPFSKAGKALILENAVDGGMDAVADPTLYQMYVSRIYAGMFLDLGGKEVCIYSPLFGGGEYYNLTADFGAGLTSKNMIGFIGGLFGLGDGKAASLMLPGSFLLDGFALRSLGVLLRVHNGSIDINGMNTVIATTKPWNLPIPGLTLKTLGINFAIQWGLKDADGTVDSYLLTGDIGASLALALPGAYEATLNATAYLPELDFEGTIYINRETSVTTATMMGYKVADSLPETPAILSIYTAAGYYSRTLFLSADINTGLDFTLGETLLVSLQEINVSAFFSTGGNNYRIRGVIQFGDAAEDSFSIALSAEYASGGSGGYWTFEGGLNSGEVKIISLIKHIVEKNNAVSKSNSLSNSFEIVLSQFYVKYQYNKNNKEKKGINPFLLRAAFDAAWEDPPFGLALYAGGLVELNTDETGKLTLSALLALDVGNFRATAQLNNLGGAASNQNYIFTFTYNGRGIQAAYLKDKDGKGVLTVNLINVSLGDAVEFLARLFIPDFEFTLPAPFDELYKVDLSKIQFCYHFDDGTLDFTYKIGLNLVLFKINSIGIRYNPGNTDENGDGERRGVYIFLDTEGLDLASYGDKKNKPLWNLLEDRPPFLNLKGGISFELSYLGLLSHRADEGGKLVSAASISEALDIIEADGITVPCKRMNFIFAADFTLCDALRVKFALVDPAIYGICITVNADEGLLKDFTGFYMELLYKRISDKLGMFKASLMMPDRFRKFNFGYVTVTLGLMSAEIYTDGSFLIDLGFPHNNDFSRSFVIEFGIYIARGGVYFGILSGAACPELPRPSGSVIRGEWSPVIKMGVGITFGIGRSFDFGIVTGGFEISITGVFEGTLAFWQKEGETDDYNNQNIYYKMQATLEIVGRLFVTVDLYIIKLEAGVTLEAFARAQLETDKPVLIDLDLSLELYGSVRILFIRVKFSYSFNYHAHFEIGGSDHSIKSKEDRPRLFKNGNFLTTRHIVDVPVAVEMFMGHAMTVSNQIVFVPMTARFNALYELCVRWSLSEIEPEVLKKEDAMRFNGAFIDDNLTYDVLMAFLAGNTVFSFGPVPAPMQDGEELNGSIIPIMPDAVLSYGETRVDFKTYRMIDNAYLALIDEYFKNLTPSQITRPSQQLNDTAQPIAQALFLDYFKMILRQIFSELRGLYENFELTADRGYVNFAAVAEKYGVSVSDIVMNNLSLTTRFSTILCDITYTAPEQTSFNAISKEFGMAADDVWQTASKSYILANSGVDFGSYAFINEFNITIDETAALFFSRWYGDKITGYYQKFCEPVRAALNADVDWECARGGDRVSFELLDGEVSLTLQIGDTIESIAKSCALALYKDKCVDGEDGAFDKFLKGITPVDSGFKVPLLSGVPAPVYSAETPAQLARRLFVDGGGQLLYSQNCIAKFAAVPLVDAKLAVAEDKKLSAAVDDYAGIDFAAALTPGNFQPGQTIVIKPLQIPVSEISGCLRSQDVGNKIAGFTSRVLAQGLRLPKPDHNDNSTIGLFELYGLQCGRNNMVKEFSIAFNNTETSYAITETYAPAAIDLAEQITVKAIPPFKSIPRIYAITEKYKIGKEVLHLMPQGIANPKLSVNGADTQFVFALCIGFDAARTGENTLSVTGIDMAQQDLLRRLFDTDVSYRVVYIPSALSGLTETMLDSGFGGGEHFIKTNLSKISKFEAEAAAALPRELICDLNSRDFLPMLWECGVTCGGYALYMPEAHKLPDDLFDKNGKCKLYLLVKNVPQMAANAALGANVLTFDTESYFYGDETDSRPAMPVGCYGYDIVYTAADADMFSILSYTLTANGKETNLSKPLIPLGGGANSGRYSAVIPVYQLFDRKNPYYDIKETKLNIYCRDVYGNMHNSEPVTIAITPMINDLTLGLNDWFGVTYSYRFLGTGIGVTISAEEKKEKKEKKEEEEEEEEKYRQICEKLRLSLLQLRHEGSKVEIRTTYGSITGLHLLRKIIVFVEGLYAYYQPNGHIPQPVTANLSSISAQDEDSKEIRVEFVVTRTGAEESVTAIPPNLPDENSDLVAFEKKFGLKIAHMNHDSSKVYAVKSSLITGVEFKDSEGFWAFAPLANTLITRTVNGAEYSDVDINLWARQFLDDFENRILCRAPLLVQSDDAVAVAVRLLCVKDALALGIADTLMNLKDGAAPSRYIRDYTANLLKTRLDTEISSVNVFSIAAPAGNSRLSVTLGRDDQARVAAFATKLENEKAGIFYRAFSRYETGFCPTFISMTVHEIERNITDIRDGYERSDWYQLLVPQAISAKLNPESVPNPLREAPSAPGIFDSKFLHNENSELWLCDYSLSVTAAAVEQDTVEIRVEFGAVSAAAKTESDDIFTALALYMSHRDDILRLLEQNNAEAVTKFTNDAEVIAKNWRALKKSERARGDGTFTAAVRLDLQNKKLHLLRSSRMAKVELITVGSNIIEGKPYTFKITVPDFSIYEVNRATPFVSVNRNSVVTSVDAFLFKTQELSLPEVFALNAFDTINAGTAALSGQFKNVFDLLVSKIGKSAAPSGFYFELTVSYAYAFENSGTDALVHLPAAMFKCALEDFSSQSASDFVQKWYNAVSPRNDKARLEFGIRISRNEKTLMSIRCMYVEALL